MAQSKPLDPSPIGSAANWDRRTIKRYIGKGQVSQKDWEAHLKALPDEEANGEWVSLNPEDSEISEDLADEVEEDESADTSAEGDSSDDGDKPY